MFEGEDKGEEETEDGDENASRGDVSGLLLLLLSEDGAFHSPNTRSLINGKRLTNRFSAEVPPAGNSSRKNDSNANAASCGESVDDDCDCDDGDVELLFDVGDALRLLLLLPARASSNSIILLYFTTTFFYAGNYIFDPRAE